MINQYKSSFILDLWDIPREKKDGANYYLSKMAREFYEQTRRDEAMEVIDGALYYDPGNAMLDELKENMAGGDVPLEETLKN